MSEKSVFDDPLYLIEIWKKLYEVQRHQIEFILSNAKFVFTLISALLATCFAIFSVKAEILIPPWHFLFISIASFLALVLSVFGIFSAKRDYERFLEIVAYKAKIESLLGLQQKIKLDILPNDEYLFHRYVKSLEKYPSTEKFVEGEIKRKDNLFNSIKILYYIFSAISSTLLLSGIFLVTQNILIFAIVILVCLAFLIVALGAHRVPRFKVLSDQIL